MRNLKKTMAAGTDQSWMTEKTIEEKKNMDLREGERIDDLQRNGYSIIQSPGRFCFGMDAVLLTGFVSVKNGARVIDLGTGTGIIPILLEAKTGASHLTGLEIQHESADMARRSVALNGLGDKIQIVDGDIREAESLFAPASFDLVTSNPPYMADSHGLKNPDDVMAIARHEVLCSLEDVIRAAAYLLPPGGNFCMVHRPFRLPEIMGLAEKYRLEPKRMQLVYPYVNAEPNMLLLQCVKGARPRLKVEKPLIVYEKPGIYMPEIYDIYGY